MNFEFYFLTDEHRLDPITYCQCGNCKQMDTVAESFCCYKYKLSKGDSLLGLYP